MALTDRMSNDDFVDHSRLGPVSQEDVKQDDHSSPGSDSSTSNVEPSARRAQGVGSAQTASVPPEAGAPATTFNKRPLAQGLVAGDVDIYGDKVDFVFSATDSYVIYCANGLVRYSLLGDPALHASLRESVAPLGGLRASIDSLRSEKPIDDIEGRRAAREVAWALGEAFEDRGKPPSEQPKQILMRVDDRLRSLVKSYYRKKYVFANLEAFAAIEFIMLLAAIVFGTTQIVSLRHYAFFGMLGGLGAFLSVIVGIKAIDLDMNLGRWEYAFTGATRILIGVIGAWIVALALDSGLFDPTFGHRQAPDAEAPFGFSTNQAMYFVLSVIGGFSETLVPNLLRRGEETTTRTASDKGTTKGPIVNDIRP